MKTVTAARMAELEKRSAVPALLLMENAGRSVAEIAIQEKPRARRALVVCGAGNNGGDGFVAARHLALRGLDVAIAAFGPASRSKPDAALNAAIARKMGLPIACRPSPPKLAAMIRRTDLVIDALFGTGLSRYLSIAHLRTVAALSAAPAKVVSVDLPSGMDADTGKAWGAAVRCSLVISLGMHKKGVVRAAKASGYKIRLADISLPL